ncbi:hypothetical protein [Sulfitobacter mediterraneus]|uniref:hypothetical protein n=1 Tax=Sulfitobacter mediterraneus TaxID=83219 RepID=UPI0012DC4C0D|nr:hypothetical protein [Sulfitobacter mediterraneus]
MTYADWQYTQWGGSPTAVIEASGGSAGPNDDRGKDPLPLVATLTAPYTGLGFNFDAYFIFDPAEQLRYVDLAPLHPESCNEIRFALMNSYGQPDKRGSFGLLKWWHRESGNVVIYSEIGACQIRYMSLSEPGQAGGL